jgi:molybdate transport system substrate-binding protein
MRNIEVFHADSLAGPMKELKTAFEARNPNVTVNLTSGRSKELSDRINQGDHCDVFAPSDPGVIKKGLMETELANWSIVFSRNEIVVVTLKGNSLEIKNIMDLSKPDVKLVRVTGEKDLATQRTIEFITNAANELGQPNLVNRIIHSTTVEARTIPEALNALKEGRANAGVIYLSAAVSEKEHMKIVAFPASVNLSDQIQNAVTVPTHALNKEEANEFVNFLLSVEGQEILRISGQPPVTPPIREGTIPVQIR